MKEKKRGRGHLSLTASIAAVVGFPALVVVVVAALMPDAVAARLTSPILPLLGLAVALQFVSYGLIGRRWHVLMQHSGTIRIPVIEMTGLQLGAQCGNLVMPAMAGDLAACFYLRSRRAVPVSMAFAASLYSRFCGLVVAAGLLLAVIPLFSDRLGNSGLVSGLLVAIAAVAASFFGLMAASLFPARSAGRLDGLIERLRARFGERPRWLGNWIERSGMFVQLFLWCLNATARHGPRLLSWALLLSGLNYLVIATSLWCLMLAFHVPLPFAFCLFLTGVSALGGVTSALRVAPGLAEEALLLAAVYAFSQSLSTAVLVVVLFVSMRCAVVSIGFGATGLLLRTLGRDQVARLREMRLEMITRRLRRAAEGDEAA